MKFVLNGIVVVYFLDHTHKDFKNSNTYYVVENLKETVIRCHHKSVLFSCVFCHSLVISTFQSYWLTLSDFSYFFQRCFFKTKSDITLNNPNKLKGKIIIGYCRGHETFTIFIRLQGYKDQYKRLLPRKFFHTVITIGNMFEKKQRDIRIVNVSRKKDLLSYPHLRLRGEIIIRKDFNTSIPEIDLCFENYFLATVCVWPSDFNAKNISLAESHIFFSEAIVNSKLV